MFNLRLLLPFGVASADWVWCIHIPEVAGQRVAAPCPQEVDRKGGRPHGQAAKVAQEVQMSPGPAVTRKA